MTRIDLKKSSGFPLLYENDSLNTFENTFNEEKVFPISKVRKQLLNDEVNCPEVFYKQYLDVNIDDAIKKNKLTTNLFVIMPNLAGVEFVKTRAVGKNANTIIEVLYGGGVIIMQNFNDTFEGDIYYSTLKKGQKLIVPKNYQYSISNTKSSILIYLEITKSSYELDDSLDGMRGMSYYVIRKNAKQEIVRNPNIV